MHVRPRILRNRHVHTSRVAGRLCRMQSRQVGPPRQRDHLDGLCTRSMRTGTRRIRRDGRRVLVRRWIPWHGRVRHGRHGRVAQRLRSVPRRHDERRRKRQCVCRHRRVSTRHGSVRKRDVHRQLGRRGSAARHVQVRVCRILRGWFRSTWTQQRPVLGHR